MSRLPRTALQAVVFALVAMLGALALNAFHPSGLELGRDYFPDLPGSAGQAGAEPGGEQENGDDPDAASAGLSPLEQWCADVGCSLIDTEDVEAYAEFAWKEGDDPNGAVYLLDARRARSFEAGHLPGATLAYYYQLDQFLDEETIERLRLASAIIVYCNGGDCEDSRFLTHDLVFRHQILPETLFVYEGGVEAWRASGRELVR